jgi:16S rRNA (guanine527-N7)-methyltransferase
MREALTAGLQQQGRSAELADPLLRYLELLIKWNKAYNLTAIRDPHEMVVLHLLDSLTAYPFVRGPNILDVGTGAGLPGIPLAIAMPEQHFTLLDTNGKKTRFLEHAVRQLPLKNVDVQKVRIEDFSIAQPYDSIVSRAFSSLSLFVDTCGPLLRPDGCLLAMKGKLPKEEITALNEAQWRIGSHELEVPGLAAERHMIVLEPLSE